MASGKSIGKANKPPNEKPKASKSGVVLAIFAEGKSLPPAKSSGLANSDSLILKASKAVKSQVCAVDEALPKSTKFPLPTANVIGLLGNGKSSVSMVICAERLKLRRVKSK